MKLGSQTGSLINHIATHGQTDTLPNVGDGATLFFWTDRKGASVDKIYRERGVDIVEVRADEAQRVDKNGMSEDQTYFHSPNPNGAVYTFKRMKDGKWASCYRSTETGRLRRSSGGPGVRFGHRDTYHDFSF